MTRPKGAAFAAPRATRGEESLPRLVRDVLLQRIARLGDDSQAVLQVASVAGRNVSYRLLAAVVQMPVDQLRRALRQAVDHHVLTVDQAAGTLGVPLDRLDAAAELLLSAAGSRAAAATTEIAT